MKCNACHNWTCFGSYGCRKPRLIDLNTTSDLSDEEISCSQKVRSHQGKLRHADGSRSGEPESQKAGVLSMCFVRYNADVACRSVEFADKGEIQPVPLTNWLRKN